MDFSLVSDGVLQQYLAFSQIYCLLFQEQLASVRAVHTISDEHTQNLSRRIQSVLCNYRFKACIASENDVLVYLRVCQNKTRLKTSVCALYDFLFLMYFVSFCLLFNSPVECV